ncbi:hypothetical protein L208DRAFT_133112 [Tricholoma matsutake]|nr:hypothetical protein L208DRAFT_133112 [Tricholoma matsutake 945]
MSNIPKSRSYTLVVFFFCSFSRAIRWSNNPNEQLSKEKVIFRTCFRSSFFLAISAAFSSLLKLDKPDIVGNGFIPASSRPSSLGGGDNDNGVEPRFGGV